LDFLKLARSEEKGTGHDGDSGKKVIEEKYRDDFWDIEVLDGGIVIRDIDNGEWDIEVPDCGIEIQCLGDHAFNVTISAGD
jgi:hypothetical protein